MKPLFSIIVVALNPGARLVQTLESIAGQTCRDYEVVIKDGGSTDSSMDEMKRLLEREEELAKRVYIFNERDKSIYDAMNQAVGHAQGEYFYFLNCGDLFYSNQALEEMKQAIETAEGEGPAIFYGDIFDALRKERVASNPKMDAFACYRHVPCHQACFYHKDLFRDRGYRPEYKVRADYEHFLWCFFEKKAQVRYVPVILASYEGGGYSETKENRKRSGSEHKEITKMYLTRGQRFRYQLILWLTLAPLRSKMAESKKFSGIYQKMKGFVYGRR